MTKNIVEIFSMCFSHGNRLVFNNINLSIPRGKITAIMGPSGSGKTTLLRLIGAQLKPDKGAVYVDGDNVHELSRKDLLKARKKIGFLFQSGALFTHLSVFENVAFPLREHSNLSEHILYEIVMMKLHSVGLRGAARMMPHQLSGGMARRVALARSIALDPQLMLYDEPFTGQDPISMGVLMKLIKRSNELLGLSSVVVSHDVKETCKIADWAYLTVGGIIIAEGEPEALMESNAPKVKQFMHGEADGAVPFHFPAKPYEEELLND